LLLLVPATLLLVALLGPRLLLALLRRLLAPTATGLPALLRRLTTLRRLTGLLTPTALLGRLTLPALLGRLTLPALLRGLSLTGLRLSGLCRRLTPAATTLAGLLSPATLTRLSARLSPLLPARLAPRLPRTPRSLWRRSHMRSLETHV
jgi:hypothetical protein